MKKLLALLLALVMVVSLVACTQKQPEETKAPAANKPEETKAPAQETDAPEAPVTLTMFHMYSDVAGTYAKEDVLKAIQAHVLETYNVDLQFIDAPYTIYNDVVNTAITAGDNWDMGDIPGTIFTANVSRNAFMAFDEYMDLIPAVVESVPDYTWDAYSYGGKIYGAAPVKDLAEFWNWIANQDLEDEIGVEFPADEFYTLRDLIPFLYEAKEARDVVYPELADQPIFGNLSQLAFYMGFDSVVGFWNSCVVATNITVEHGFTSVGDTGSLFCPWMTEDFRDMVKVYWQACQDGVVAGVDGFDPDKYLEQNGYLIGAGNCGLIEYDPEITLPNYRNTMYVANIGNSYTAYLQAGVQCINAKCANPEKAFEMLNAFYSDETLCNMFKFGIEGEHWTDENNDGVAEFTEANSDANNRAYYNWYPYVNLVSTTCGAVAPGCTPEFAEKMAAVNEKGVGSPLMGFLADTTAIADEVAACQAVISEYATQWQYPSVYKSEAEIDAMCDKFAEDLKANGIDTIMAEIQKQVDAWKAAN